MRLLWCVPVMRDAAVIDTAASLRPVLCGYLTFLAQIITLFVISLMGCP